LTPGASGSVYTAPTDGWFCINFDGSNNNSYANFTVNNLYRENLYSCRDYNTGYRKIFPVKKGDILKIDYNFKALNLLNFYYANGSQPA
jgi:hypothetical protein